MRITVLVLIILTIATKFFGFLRDIVFSYYYGASYISDAYIISQTIPFTIFTLIGTAITTSFIPIYIRIKKNQGKKSADIFTSTLINNIFVISVFISFTMFLLAKPLVKLFAFGFTGATFHLAVQFTKISVFGICVIGMTYVLKGYLEQKKKFYVTGLISLPLNLVFIMTIILSVNWGYYLLPIGNLAALFFQLLFIYIMSFIYGYRHNIKKSYKNTEDIKKMIYMSIPILMGISVNEINGIIDRTIASHLETGAISALTYANRLSLFIQGVFGMSIATVMFPLIAKKASEKNFEGFKKNLSDSIGGVNILVIPSVIIVMLFAEPIVKLVFGRGAFDNTALIMTSSALFFYSIGMIGFGLREILSRAFYALQDTKTPTLNATIGMVVNIILNLILSRYLGIGGLALATSLSAIFTTLLLFNSLRKKIGTFILRNVYISFLKIIVASIISGLVAKFIYLNMMLEINDNLKLIFTLIVGGLIYLILMLVLKVDEFKSITNILKNKIKNKN